MESKGNCLKCGRLTEHAFCPGCLAEGQHQIRAIQAFVKRYPGVSVIEVCRELRISLELVKGLVSRGYLNLDIPRELVLEADREMPAKQEKPEANRSSGFYSARKKR